MSKEDLVLKKIKSIELKTKKLVSALNLGNYKSALKGQGMTFSDFREYVPGDDVRNISWSLIAKTNKPYVKQFEEERELSVYFLMDTSYSMYSGASYNLKIETAMYVMASVAMSAQKNNDLSGLILFSKNMELFVRPKKSQSHVRRLITEILKFKPYTTSSEGLIEACNLVLEHQKKKSVVFIFSDFVNLPENKKILQTLSKKHQVVACVMNDNSMKPESFSILGDLKFNDLSDSIIVNSKWTNIQNLWNTYLGSMESKKNAFLKSNSMDQIVFNTNEDFFKPLMLYFKKKSRS